MPGLYGFTLRSSGDTGAPQRLDGMSDLLRHRPYYKQESCFLDEALCASRVHLNLQQTYPQPVTSSGVCIWLEGEFYNQSELAQLHQVKAENDAALLGRLYESKPDMSFLKGIDGHFAAVIYDKSRGLVHLIADRYGLRYLFYSVRGDQLAWAPETKAFLSVPGFSPAVDTEAVQNYFQYGHMTKDETWYKDVKLLDSGTVLTWNLKTKSASKHRYWWWSEIQPLPEKIDQDEIADELGRLFKQAVLDRCREGSRVGLTLSGGLDSRAILAAMPPTDKPIVAVTFGKHECPDIRFARMAAAEKGAVHKVYEITSKGWLDSRFEGVWITDGHMTLLDMHFFDVAEKMRDHMEFSMDGYLGDAVLGGGYQPGHLGWGGWNELEKIDNRGRRYIAEGGRLGNTFLLFDRYPFFNNKLMELSYAIPAIYRKDSAIYNRMLLRTFPKFFEKIPWQKTMLPIGASPLRLKAQKAGNWLRARAVNAARRLKIHLEMPNTGYASYQEWIRSEPARSQIGNLITSKDALLFQYVDRDLVIGEYNKHMAGENRSRPIALYATFEIWLQQVFASKHRRSWE